jgi:hypothetical protein
LHKFLESLNPRLVSRFEALMTNERAEHFLMDRTMADTSLITEENYEAILREIEDQAAERVERRKNEEIAALRAEQEQREAEHRQLEAEHQRRLDGLTTEAEGRSESLRQESARSVVLEGELARAKEAQEAERGRAEAASAALIQANARWAEGGMRAGKNAERRLRLLVILGAEVLSAGVAEIATDSADIRLLVFVGAVGVSILATMFGENAWPSNPVSSWISRRRDASCTDFLAMNKVPHVAAEFEFDWDGGEVRPK